MSQQRRTSMRKNPGGAGGGAGGGGAELAKPNVFRIPSNISVKLGLQWSFIGDNPVDLDVSCVAFDQNCKCVEAIFFGNLHAKDGYMIHTGDNTTGEDVGDDDESIIFHMGLIPPDVHYLMVCVTSYTGADFTVVSSAHVRVVNQATKDVEGSFQLGVVGKHTGTLLCTFNRAEAMAAPQSTLGVSGTGEDPQAQSGSHPLSWWELREINLPCQGYTFVDVLPRMLAMLDIKDHEVDECVESLPNYSLEKAEEDLTNVVLSQLKFGVGWDGENDLDACLIMVDRDSKYVDHVYAKYGKLKTRDDAVVHSGDKLNGYEVDGDDEFILVNLMKVDKRVHQIFFICILYSGFSKFLADVPKTYCRLGNNSSPLAETPHRQIVKIDVNLLKDEEATVFVPFICEREDSTHWRKIETDQTMKGKDWIDIFPFVRAFSALDLDAERWQRWSKDVFPFSVKVTFIGTRRLGPLEPHQFACHCSAWVCDQKEPENDRKKPPQDRSRFKSETIRDRDNVTWNESHIFTLTKLDVIRVMVYETAVVGHADISMAEYFPGEVPSQLVTHRNPMDGSPANPQLKIVDRGESAATAASPSSPASTAARKPSQSSTMNNTNPAAADATAADTKNSTQNSQDALLGGTWSQRKFANNSDGGEPTSPREGNPNNKAQKPPASPRATAAAPVAAKDDDDEVELSTINANSKTQEGTAAADDKGEGEDPLGQKLSGTENSDDQLRLNALGTKAVQIPLYENTRSAPVFEGETLVDGWFPLIGKGISGEIRLKVERVPLKEMNEGEDWCVIA